MASWLAKFIRKRVPENRSVVSYVVQQPSANNLATTLLFSTVDVMESTLLTGVLYIN